MVNFSISFNAAAKNSLFLAVVFFIQIFIHSDGEAQTDLVLDYEKGTFFDLGQTISVDPDNQNILMGSFQKFLPTSRGVLGNLYPLDIFDFAGVLQSSYLDTLGSRDGVSAANSKQWCSWGNASFFLDDPEGTSTSVIRCISSRGDTLGSRGMYPLKHPDSLFLVLFDDGYGDIAIEDSLVVIAVREIKSDSVARLAFKRFLIVTDPTLTRWDSIPICDVVTGVPFRVDRVDVSSKDSLIGLIGFTEDQNSRSGDSIVIQILNLSGDLVNSIAFNNVGRYSNETNSFSSAPSIGFLPEGNFVAVYPRYDSSLSPIPSHDNIVTTISKYSRTGASPDWTYYPKYDSSQNYRIRGVKYDEIKHQVLFYGHGLKFEVYNENLAYSFGFISALDPDTGELLWERYIDPRSPENQQGTNPEVDYTLQIINDIALEDTTSIFVVGSIGSDPSTAFYHDTPPSSNENPWIARLDRNGCFNGDCGEGTNNQVSVSPVFEFPFKTPKQEVLFELYPSPVRQGQAISASWISERIVAPKQINIFNSIGQKVLSPLSNGNFRSISVQQLVPGNYFMKWGDYSRAFVVQ